MNEENVTNQTQPGTMLSKIVPIDLISADSGQPRKNFNEESLKQLADSVADKGILQPLIVSEQDGRYRLIAGERRLRAARMAGLKNVPVLVTKDDPVEISIIENLQREDLNPVDEAEALLRLQTDKKYTQAELGKVIGKDQSAVSYLLSINKLPDAVKAEARVQSGLSERTLREIAKLKSTAEMTSAWQHYTETQTLPPRKRLGRKPGSKTNKDSQIVKFTTYIRKIKTRKIAHEDWLKLREALSELREEIDRMIEK